MRKIRAYDDIVSPVLSLSLFCFGLAYFEIWCQFIVGVELGRVAPTGPFLIGLLVREGEARARCIPHLFRVSKVTNLP